MNRQHDIEAYGRDEDDWLCTVEFLSSDDSEGRVFAADIVGYLFGNAQMTNARALALVGDPEAGAYELIFRPNALRKSAHIAAVLFDRPSGPRAGSTYNTLAPTSFQVSGAFKI